MPRIKEIYAYARQFMEQNGNPNQWGKTNPPVEKLEEDIDRGNLYVIEEETFVHGVFAFILGTDPTYVTIYEGCWRYEEPYGTIHRIAGDGSGGILKCCLEYCSRVIEYLRIDTHQDNHVMQNALQKAGFKRCGIILLENGSPRIAYDRK